MKDSLKEKINKDRIPAHVAIIMDGNGRWAKNRGLERIFGHQHAVQSVRDVTEAAAEIGIKYLTLYAFSTENWGRPQAEVDALMDLLVRTLENETPTLNKNNIQLKVIGDLSRLPKSVYDRLQLCIKETSVNTGMSMVVALSYSSRWEMTNAMQQIALKVEKGEISVSDVNEELIASELVTSFMPDPDLLIRTSGELRISNFLLWQLAYSEFYFTNINWPDFRKKDFFEAILSYQARERRFGKTTDQLAKP